MDTASRTARAEQMGFRTDRPIAFGVAPEGEKIAKAAIDVGPLDGPTRIYTGQNHPDAILKAEADLGIDFFDMKPGPILDGFITNTGRYVSRWEAADLAARAKQGKARGRFGALRGLATEDTAISETKPTGKFNTGATASGLPGGQGAWGHPLSGTDTPAAGSTALWYRTDRPFQMDVSGAADHEIQAALKEIWDMGHDAALLENYKTPAGAVKDVIVVKDLAQLRDPRAKFDPKKRMSRNIMAGVAGASGVPLSALLEMPPHERDNR
jgi:hypothetical protein